MITPQWKLEKKHFLKTQSPYTKNKQSACYEFPDYNLINGFIKSTQNFPMDTVDDDRVHAVALKKKYTDEKQVYEEYMKHYNKNKIGVKVEYKIQPYCYGRIQAVNWLTMSVFPRPSRHLFLKGNYYDFDMVNCQVAVLYLVSQKTSLKYLKFPILKEAYERPKEFRAMIMDHHGVTKDVAKRLPIALCNGGRYKTWLAKYCPDAPICPEIVKLEKELQPIREEIYHNNADIKNSVLEAYPDKWSKEDGKLCEYEAKNGVVALWYQSYERLLQEAAIKYVCKTYIVDYRNIIPSQDGFMMRQMDIREDKIPELTAALNELMLKQFQLPIEWVNKPFDEARNDICAVKFDKSADAELKQSLQARNIALRFIDSDLVNNIVLSNGELYIYWKDRWYNETDSRHRYKFTLLVSHSLYDLVKNDLISSGLKPDDDTFNKLAHIFSKIASINDIQKHIISLLDDTSLSFDTKEHLLGFKNGVYDLRTDSFRPYQFDDYMTMSTLYDYEPALEEDEKKIEELEQIFANIHRDKELLEYYWKILCSGLDGMLYQAVYQFNGPGGNGKGLSALLMSKVLGQYFLTPNNAVLRDLEKSNSASPDMYLLRGKRYLCFQELEGDIKVNLIRSLTGGGSKVARPLYGKPIEFNIQSTIVMEFNSNPHYSGVVRNADYRRTFNVPFSTIFTTNEKKIGRERNGVLYMRANSLYESHEWANEMKIPFLHLLLRKYKKYKKQEDTFQGIDLSSVPSVVIAASKQFLEDQNIFRRILYIKYEDDKENPTSFIMAQELYQACRTTSEYMELSAREKTTEFQKSKFYLFLKEEFETQETNNRGLKVFGIKAKEYLYDDLSEDE